MRPFPAVPYLSHSFTLAPHPTGQDAVCVANKGVPVTNEAEQDWLLARRLGITASGFGDLVTRAGERSKSRKRVIEAKVMGIERNVSHVEAFALGREHEPIIAAKVQDQYGIEPNHWLISSPDQPRFLATPDGYSSDFVAEYKTSIKSWGQNLYSYYRQIQWQLFVGEREASVFAVLNPRTQAYMAGLVPRDEAEIALLSSVAREVLDEMDSFGAVTPDPADLWTVKPEASLPF